MVYINTLMIQQVLEEPGWSNRMTPRDLAALSPLIIQHLNPYGRFELDMETRLTLADQSIAPDNNTVHYWLVTYWLQNIFLQMAPYCTNVGVSPYWLSSVFIETILVSPT
jgi:hypothetical protein